MEVRVTKLTWPYCEASTESLQAVLRNHAEDRFIGNISTKQLYEIMDVLASRSKQSGEPWSSPDEAWARFVKVFLTDSVFFESSENKVTQDLLTPHKLTPSFQGKECLGNGEWPGYECQCDE